MMNRKTQMDISILTGEYYLENVSFKDEFSNYNFFKYNLMYHGYTFDDMYKLITDVENCIESLVGLMQWRKFSYGRELDRLIHVYNNWESIHFPPSTTLYNSVDLTTKFKDNLYVANLDKRVSLDLLIHTLKSMATQSHTRNTTMSFGNDEGMDDELTITQDGDTITLNINSNLIRRL